MLVSDIDYMKFEMLWNEQSLKEEVKEFFGEFDESLWNLDAGIDNALNQCLAEGKSVESYYETTTAYIYQSGWNCATNDERTKYLRIREIAIENNVRTALDFGCATGSGVITLGLAGLDEVYGVDMCKPSLEFLKKRIERYGLTNAKTISARARGKGNWKSKKVDMVICTEVLEHVEDPHELMRDLVNILNPHGVMVLSWSFVPMAGHLPEHFYLQALHPDELLTTGFGKYVREELGLQFVKYNWFNNMLWVLP